MIINDLDNICRRLENFCNIEKKETIKLLKNVQKVNESVPVNHILYERLRQKIPIRFPIKRFLPFWRFYAKKSYKFFKNIKNLQQLIGIQKNEREL